MVDECGLSVFDLLRYRRYDHAAIHCAFDLIELDGDDLRSLAIEHRKGRLERILRPARRSQTGITLNEHYEGDGIEGINFGVEKLLEQSAKRSRLW